MDVAVGGGCMNPCFNSNHQIYIARINRRSEGKTYGRAFQRLVPTNTIAVVRIMNNKIRLEHICSPNGRRNSGRREARKEGSTAAAAVALTAWANFKMADSPSRTFREKSQGWRQLFYRCRVLRYF